MPPYTHWTVYAKLLTQGSLSQADVYSSVISPAAALQQTSQKVLIALVPSGVTGDT